MRVNPIRMQWVVASLAMALTNVASAVDQAIAVREITEWRAQRTANLQSDRGWLTLVGLYWLSEGDNTFGRSASNHLQLNRAGVPTTIGTFALRDKHLTFTAQPGVAVMEAEKLIKQTTMRSDAEENPTVLSVGTVQFFAIERGGRIGVRVRDTAHPARAAFQGLEYFPIDARWVIDARFEPYKPAKQIPITNILGMTEPMTSPGAVVFERNGKSYRLDTLLELPDDEELFIMFADATNARETYGAGRFLYIPMPKNGRALIDFNRAYNPPCAFNDFATCPLPPAQNRLPLRIEAGEKKYAAH